MATFDGLVAEIEGDLSAGVGDLLDTEIRRAIIRAIEFYENQRFVFNEGRTSFSTVVDQTEYDLTTEAPNVLSFDAVQYLEAGRLYVLDEQSYEEILHLLIDESAQTGPSRCYAIYEQKMFLYPAPDEITTVTISGIHRLTPSPLSDGADTNAWLQQGLQMIKARAKADLFMNRHYNKDLANVQNEIANSFLIEHRAERERFMMRDTVGPVGHF